MPIRKTPPAALVRQYPHVNEVQDWRASQTIRLLWDRIHDLEARLQAADTTLDDLIDGHNTNEASIDTVGQDARMAMTVSQQVRESVLLPGSGNGAPGSGGGGGTPLPGGGDGGGGAEGCAAAGATGHDTGGLLNPVRAGQIVCGTGNEFSALKNATATLAEREANAEELLRRMIWHLKLAGFVAGRQNNSQSGVRLSKDKLCVVVDGVLRVYDVFGNVDGYTEPMQTRMGETSPARMIDDDGIPD